MSEELLKELLKITPEEQEILDGRYTIDPTLYNLNHNMVVDCHRLLEKGKLITLRPHTRFIRFPEHSHNYVEVVYMCSGQTRHLINGNDLILQTGELLFLSQNAVQEIYPAAEQDLAVNFIILPEFFDRSLAMLGNGNSLIRNFLIECLKSGSQNINYLHFKVAEVRPIQNLIENLIWLLLNEQNNKRSLNQTTMGLLFLHLMNLTDKAEIGKNHYPQELVLTVFRFIEDHYRDGELSELAKSLSRDLYFLSRVIKTATGRTYTSLLQEKRLGQAAWLLQNTGLPVTDVCMDVGYHNFSYFYKLFRKQYRMSPLEYRRANQGAQLK